MPGDKEIPLQLRRWQGVNLAHDEAFVDPSFLRASDNWVPAETYLLTKRRGTALYLDMDAGALNDTLRVHSMIRVHSGANRYLFAVRNYLDTYDQVVFSTNDADFAAAGGLHSFSTFNSRYGMVAHGGYIYVGNGLATDEIKKIPFTGTAVDLTSLSALTPTGATATVVSDSTSQLSSGTYSYCWAVYNTSTKRWISRSSPAEVSITSTRARIDFLSPSGAPGANQLYHLFITPVNLPLEYAHDHITEGVGASATFAVTDITISSTPVPSPQSVIRSGRSLKIHLNRLWIARDQVNKNNVYASSILLPGLEQSIYDQFQFFPANAVIPMDEEVTGISPVTVGSTSEQPQGPMAICSETKTWLWFGDILDDPNSYLIPISGEVGCVAQDTMIPTREGLIFCGRDSVYMLRPDSIIPVDIGWPIAPSIKAIPRAVRADCWAIYHQGFYKLAIIPPGSVFPVRQWWLDLRGGLGSIPSWWGPHKILGYSCACTTRKDLAEDDRAFGAVTGSGNVVLLDQEGSYQDMGYDIKSSLVTQYLDNKRPFERKQFRRVRVNGKAEPDATLAVTIQTDGGINQAADPLVISGTLGGIWDVAEWDVDSWGTTIWAEAESILDPRPMGVSARLQLVHSDAGRVDLRDFEIRYEPVERKVS